MQVILLTEVNLKYYQVVLYKFKLNFSGLMSHITIIGLSRVVIWRCSRGAQLRCIQGDMTCEIRRARMPILKKHQCLHIYQR